MKSRSLTITASNYNPEEETRYPSLRLQGKWLEQAGFLIGHRVAVEVEEGQVTIKAQKGGEMT